MIVLLRWLLSAGVVVGIYGETGPFTAAGIIGLTIALEMNLWIHKRNLADNIQQTVQDLRTEVREIARRERGRL